MTSIPLLELLSMEVIPISLNTISLPSFPKMVSKKIMREKKKHEGTKKTKEKKNTKEKKREGKKNTEEKKHEGKIQIRRLT